jgi:hypothetical protein
MMNNAPEPLFKAKILMSYKEDIENRGFWDWLKAHQTTLMEPLHKFKGEIRLYDDILELEGRGGKGDYTLLVCTNKQLRDVFLGFDNTFTIMEDRMLGLTFRPLRIKIENGNKDFTLYIIINYDKILRTADNIKWQKILTEWKKEPTH